MEMNDNPNSEYINELRELYNSNFWPKGQETAASVSITMHIGGRSIDFPVMSVWPSNTIHDIFLEYVNFLRTAPPVPAPAAVQVAAKPVEATPALAPVVVSTSTTSASDLIDVGQVTYRSNEYLVEQTGGESFRVLRKKDRTEVNSISPTAKAIIKIFSKG